MEEEKKLTLYEEDIYEKVEPKEETRQFVVFGVSGEWYALAAVEVRIITKIEKITYLPCAPEYIAGIVNLRGSILSVTDLKNIFGLAQGELSRKSRLVVITQGTLETGLLVDEVTEVVDMPLSKIDPALTTLPPERSGYIEGEFRLSDKLGNNGLASDRPQGHGLASFGQSHSQSHKLGNNGLASGSQSHKLVGILKIEKILERH